MSAFNILFENAEEEPKGEKLSEPEFFRDLNLDQIVSSITSGWQEYDLKSFFHTNLNNPTSISYRHEIMQDLEKTELIDGIKSFSRKMRAVRQYLTTAEKISYQYSKERWFVDSAELYCEAIKKLYQDLDRYSPESYGLQKVKNYLSKYVESEHFNSLLTETKEVKRALLQIRYCVLIKDGSVTVRNYESEIDYSTVIEEVFTKFKRESEKDYRVRLSVPGMNRIEANILECVAKLNPEPFHALDHYYSKHQDFVDKTIADFERQIQFYIAYLDYIKTFKDAGLKFCYPRVSTDFREIRSRESFDLALANKLILEKTIICNDFALIGKERILVVTGPNQGGKTTFARTFGQLHYLASLGCPVPGSEAQLLLFDRLFTHFEKEEKMANLRGKLQDDLVRIKQIIDQATSHSIVIINEIFSSTTIKDATYLGKKVIQSLSDRDVLGVCVTFIDELSVLNEKTVSMVATIVPHNPALRTYKIEREPANGRAYALAIAQKYQLTYEQLKGRIKR